MAHSVKAMLKKTSLEDLALPSNIGYGRSIYTRGGLELVKMNDLEIEAWAGGLSGNVKSGGGSRRHVWFWVKNGELLWHCSGNPKDHDIFCKHCVAVALSVCASNQTHYSI